MNPTQVEVSLQNMIRSVREQLGRRNMTFSALFIGMKADTNQPSGTMIVMAEDVHPKFRIEMLRELISRAQQTIEHYQRKL